MALTVTARLAQSGESGTATWDASRASGFAAYMLLWASTASGVAIHMRLRPSGGPLAVVLELHRVTSTLALAFVAVHVTALLLDPVVHFAPIDVVLPFTSGYRPLAVGLGTLAQWLLVAVLSSTALAGRLSYGAWRRLHYLSFPCYALALAHGVLAGTSSDDGTALIRYAATAAGLAAVAVVRLAGRGWVTAGEA